MKSSPLIVGALVFPALLLSGCLFGGVRDHASLATALQNRGFTVTKTFEKISSPLFEPDGFAVRLNKRMEIDTYELSSSGKAQAAASMIASDGMPTAFPQWQWRDGPPHFYRNGNFMALYQGTDGNIEAALEAILGPQFAGGPATPPSSSSSSSPEVMENASLSSAMMSSASSKTRASAGSAKLKRVKVQMHVPPSH
ncbi:hypothetical protein HY285_03075 [Candidatus Peregrinibacteria bacterium]|nr:hypothetical protein [Candidatus Peregrinibacteria bacterium]MBI3816499.1 hypothetical protein [Candidatus Peregrinibacteria bacterium]